MLLEGMLARRMYFPEARLAGTPRDFGLPFEDVAFVSGGSLLHGWLIPGEGTPWLWSHGNGGNISHRLEHAAALHGRFGMPLFLYDYSGYGQSEGKPTVKGTYDDAVAALDAFTAALGCSTADVVSFGQSLGGAVATQLSTALPMKALILESTFTSISDVVNRTYARPLSRAFAGIYDTHSRLGDVNAPVLLMHGSRDEIVPPDMSRRLFEEAGPPKTFRMLPGAGHDNVHLSDGYMTIIDTFLELL